MLIDNAWKYFFNKPLAGQAVGALNSPSIDHGVLTPGDLAVGHPVYLDIKVEDDIVSAGAATVAFKLQHSDDDSAWSDTDISYGAVGKADLVAGWSKRIALPTGLKRYTRLVATVGTAALTGGQISAFLSES